MTNRPIVIRLRPYTSTLSWAELTSLTKQGVIDFYAADNAFEPFTVAEIKQLNRWGKNAFNFLKNEWIMAQHEDFIENRYLPAFRSAINPSLSSYTVRQVYEYTLSQGLSVDTANFIHKKAVATYHGEVN